MDCGLKVTVSNAVLISFLTVFDVDTVSEVDTTPMVIFDSTVLVWKVLVLVG